MLIAGKTSVTGALLTFNNCTSLELFTVIEDYCKDGRIVQNHFFSPNIPIIKTSMLRQHIRDVTDYKFVFEFPPNHNSLAHYDALKKKCCELMAEAVNFALSQKLEYKVLAETKPNVFTIKKQSNF